MIPLAATEFVKGERAGSLSGGGAGGRARSCFTIITPADTQVLSAQTELEILTIRAPRDGALLQVNIREGEYAGTSPAEPLMVLGEVARLQVRADVDEQNAPMVLPNQPAVAYLKDSTSHPLALRFVRIDPYVIPKC